LVVFQLVVFFVVEGEDEGWGGHWGFALEFAGVVGGDEGFFCLDDDYDVGVSVDEVVGVDAFISFELVDFYCFLYLLLHYCLDGTHEEFLLHFSLFEDVSDEKGAMLHETCASHSRVLIG
jgi:hypothetical protein